MLVIVRWLTFPVMSARHHGAEAIADIHTTVEEDSMEPPAAWCAGE